MKKQLCLLLLWASTIRPIDITLCSITLEDFPSKGETTGLLLDYDHDKAVLDKYIRQFIAYMFNRSKIDSVKKQQHIDNIDGYIDCAFNRIGGFVNNYLQKSYRFYDGDKKEYVTIAGPVFVLTASEKKKNKDIFDNNVLAKNDKFQIEPDPLWDTNADEYIQFKELVNDYLDKNYASDNDKRAELQHIRSAMQYIKYMVCKPEGNMPNKEKPNQNPPKCAGSENKGQRWAADIIETFVSYLLDAYIESNGGRAHIFTDITVDYSDDTVSTTTAQNKLFSALGLSATTSDANVITAYTTAYAAWQPTAIQGKKLIDLQTTLNKNSALSELAQKDVKGKTTTSDFAAGVLKTLDYIYEKLLPERSTYLKILGVPYNTSKTKIKGAWTTLSNTWSTTSTQGKSIKDLQKQLAENKGLSDLVAKDVAQITDPQKFRAAVAKALEDMRKKLIPGSTSGSTTSITPAASETPGKTAREKQLRAFGLPATATQSDISSAYKKLALTWHPDKVASKSLKDLQAQLNQNQDLKDLVSDDVTGITEPSKFATAVTKVLNQLKEDLTK